MFNYAAWVKAKLDDPATPTSEYMRWWNEWQDIVFRQNVIDAAAEAKRLDPTAGVHLHGVRHSLTH